MVGRPPRGSGIRAVVGAGDPTVGTGATSLAGGARKVGSSRWMAEAMSLSDMLAGV